jgi:protein SCO1/2
MALRTLGVGIVCFGLGALTAGSMSWWNRGHRNDSEAIRAALRKNPEILADHPELLAAVEARVRSREQNAHAAARRELLDTKWPRVTHASFAPNLGNASGDSTLIEFTDYGCEPCRASAPAVDAVLESMPNLRIVVLLLPTSGAISEFAARIAYAAWLQNPARFGQFHRLMLSSEEELTSQAILRHAGDAGLDLEQLQAEANSPEVRAHLTQVRELAQDLQVVGVPTFVCDGRLLSGGVSAAQLDAFAKSMPRVVMADIARSSLSRPQFALVDQTGQPRTLSTYRGRWLLVYFGFTSCPDVCPTSLLRLAQALKILGGQARSITPALITVDPERDTPEILGRYVRNFGDAFVGLTGTRAQISAALESFGAYSEPAKDQQGSPSHSALFYLLDPRGHLSRRMSSDLSAPQLAHYLRRALAQDKPARRQPLSAKDL